MPGNCSGGLPVGRGGQVHRRPTWPSISRRRLAEAPVFPPGWKPRLYGRQEDARRYGFQECALANCGLAGLGLTGSLAALWV